MVKETCSVKVCVLARVPWTSLRAVTSTVCSLTGGDDGGCAERWARQRKWSH